MTDKQAREILEKVINVGLRTVHLSAEYDPELQLKETEIRCECITVLLQPAFEYMKTMDVENLPELMVQFESLYQTMVDRGQIQKD